MKPILVFQTDFTYKEGAVPAMYGVVKSVDRELEIFDATHEIPQYDIWSASYRLYQYIRFWPAGTIFVSVVDPGVGTTRKPCVAETNDGYWIVTPDNGTLTHVKQWMGIRAVYEIDTETNRLHGKQTESTSVFHGRDVFGYTAARLASGLIDRDSIGQAYDPGEIVSLPILQPKIIKGRATGIFEISDPNFGNLWTNITLQELERAGFRFGDRIKTTVRRSGEVVYRADLLFEKSFGFAAKGEVLIYNNELNRVSLAINQGSFSEEYLLGYGPEWTVDFEQLQ